MSTVTLRTLHPAQSAAARTSTPPAYGDVSLSDAGLTDREMEVLSLIAQGYSNKEIASALYLSINSIKTYVRTAYRRINVERRTQAVLWTLARVPQVPAPLA